MTETPPDWVLLEAAKRCKWEVGHLTTLAFRALCDMIQKHEQPPVDRKLLCAREAYATTPLLSSSVEYCIRAIELWEEGFGK